MRKIIKLMKSNTPRYLADSVLVLRVSDLGSCKLSPFGNKENSRKWHNEAKKFLRAAAGTCPYVIVSRSILKTDWTIHTNEIIVRGFSKQQYKEFMAIETSKGVPAKPVEAANDTVATDSETNAA
jgi:hypothetical protein